MLDASAHNCQVKQSLDRCYDWLWGNTRRKGNGGLQINQSSKQTRHTQDGTPTSGACRVTLCRKHMMQAVRAKPVPPPNPPFTQGPHGVCLQGCLEHEEQTRHKDTGRVHACTCAVQQTHANSITQSQSGHTQGALAGWTPPPQPLLTAHNPSTTTTTTTTLAVRARRGNNPSGPFGVCHHPLRSRPTRQQQYTRCARTNPSCPGARVMSAGKSRHTPPANAAPTPHPMCAVTNTPATCVRSCAQAQQSCSLTPPRHAPVRLEMKCTAPSCTVPFPYTPTQSAASWLVLSRHSRGPPTHHTHRQYMHTATAMAKSSRHNGHAQPSSQWVIEYMHSRPCHFPSGYRPCRRKHKPQP